GVSADAFAADTNGDGIPDGEQLDVDGDGTADAVDTDLEDAAVSYAVGQLPRYALFPITNAEPPAPYRTPIEVNDRGEVLYANGIWQGGVWTPLPGYAATSSSSVMAFQMNDLGEVVGIVNGDFEHEGGTVLASYDMPGNVVHWPDKETWCSPVVDGDRWAWLGSPLLTYPGLPQIQLSNDGRIIAAANYFETEDGIRSLEWDGNHLWTLAGPGRTAGRSPCAFYEGARSGPPRCGDTNGSWTRTVASPSNAS
ncbi:MAG: hypothetical protein KDN05_15875, partial [Verrucomicrobiae bacterium]|nr:hypothetical protein [Verrucomicrobiae bacterium]